MQPDIAQDPERAREHSSLVLFYPALDNPYLQQVKLRLMRRKSLQVIETISAHEILEETQRAETGLLFLSIRDIRELRLALRCLRQLQGLIDGGALRVLGISDIEDPRAARLLARRGCIDVFPANLIWNQLESNINHSLSLLTMRRLVGDWAEAGKASERPRAEPIIERMESCDIMPFAPELNPKLKVWMGLDNPDDATLIEAKPIEFCADSIILELGAGIFQEGQNVVLVVDDCTDGPGAKIKISATINGVVPVDSRQDVVSIAAPKQLKKFLAMTEKRFTELQTRIHDFLRAARGW